jgi:dTMP kinase
LDHGDVVILDRYYLSTAAYQGARGLDPSEIIRANEAFAPNSRSRTPAGRPIPQQDTPESASAAGHRTISKAPRISPRSAAIFLTLDRPFIRKIDATRDAAAVSADAILCLDEALRARGLIA